ncbi:MAG: hypothetical protein E7253_06765 [Lachnospiraceae bacterium]|nr:hypothetical protein [Lachnospiraceae bacterium]
MQVLKLEQNLFEELGRIVSVTEEARDDSLFRSMAVDFYKKAEKITVEKRKYPYFYKYYLYFGEDLLNPVSLREREGAEFLIAFYQKFCPDYVKNPNFDEEAGMKPDLYFHMNLVPGESMQHFVPGKGSVEEVIPKEKRDAQGFRVLDGFHEFSEEEKKDVGGQLDALKNQFADQLKELEALLGRK